MRTLGTIPGFAYIGSCVGPGLEDFAGTALRVVRSFTRRRPDLKEREL